MKTEAILSIRKSKPKGLMYHRSKRNKWLNQCHNTSDVLFVHHLPTFSPGVFKGDIVPCIVYIQSNLVQTMLNRVDLYSYEKPDEFKQSLSTVYDKDSVAILNLKAKVPGFMSFEIKGIYELENRVFSTYDSSGTPAIAYRYGLLIQHKYVSNRDIPVFNNPLAQVNQIIQEFLSHEGNLKFTLDSLMQKIPNEEQLIQNLFGSSSFPGNVSHESNIPTITNLDTDPSGAEGSEEQESPSSERLIILDELLTRLLNIGTMADGQNQERGSNSTPTPTPTQNSFSPSSRSSSSRTGDNEVTIQTHVEQENPQSIHLWGLEGQYGPGMEMEEEEEDEFDVLCSEDTDLLGIMPEDAYVDCSFP